MTFRPLLALMATCLVAPMVAQNPPTAPQQPRMERQQVPELTAEQRTKLRAIQDRHRDAMRDISDRRQAAERKQEDELRAVLTPEQFRAMRGRMAQQGRGVERGGRGGGRNAGRAAPAPRGGMMQRGPGAPGAGMQQGGPPAMAPRRAPAPPAQPE
ncbi:MAG: hypothetical protein SFU84_14915 [Gemmatimonadales bacterium]|nr:hypothetical protein [Gemmatimonadales bacterium]